MHWPYSVSAAEFLSTLPARGATPSSGPRRPPSAPFLSTLPARGATHQGHDKAPFYRNFYPRSPRGERRPGSISFRLKRTDFYPRSPRGERPQRPRDLPAAADFYPRSPRGERPDGSMYYGEWIIFLSTLPARGATGIGQFQLILAVQFLSTLPARGATVICPLAGRIIRFLSTLPARGATGGVPAADPHQPISIHAPREGSDAVTSCLPRLSQLFLSTLPARGATPCRLPLSKRSSNFYPRSPRGERRVAQGLFVLPGGVFLSTLPARGATYGNEQINVVLGISIHAPREGSDNVARYRAPTLDLFLSTLPARGATRGTGRGIGRSGFLSTLPARGATTPCWT